MIGLLKEPWLWGLLVLAGIVAKAFWDICRR